jgi:hypothetical protein
MQGKIKVFAERVCNQAGDVHLCRPSACKPSERLKAEPNHSACSTVFEHFLCDTFDEAKQLVKEGHGSHILRKTCAFLCLILSVVSLKAFDEAAEPLKIESPFLRVEFAPERPALIALAVDSLGKGKLSVNTLLPQTGAASGQSARRNKSRIEYRPAGALPSLPPVWAFDVVGGVMDFRSTYSGNTPAPPLVMDFDLEVCHATLLGRMKDDGSVVLPALLHLPDYGTLRITSKSAQHLVLGYEVIPYSAPRQKQKFVRNSAVLRKRCAMSSMRWRSWPSIRAARNLHKTRALTVSVETFSIFSSRARVPARSPTILPAILARSRSLNMGRSHLRLHRLLQG